MEGFHLLQVRDRGCFCIILLPAEINGDCLQNERGLRTFLTQRRTHQPLVTHIVSGDISSTYMTRSIFVLGEPARVQRNSLYSCPSTYAHTTLMPFNDEHWNCPNSLIIYNNTYIHFGKSTVVSSTASAVFHLKCCCQSGMSIGKKACFDVACLLSNEKILSV